MTWCDVNKGEKKRRRNGKMEKMGMQNDTLASDIVSNSSSHCTVATQVE